MEKKFQFFRKLLLLTLLMLGVGSAFGADELKCPANTQWGEFKTVVATKGSDNYYVIHNPTIFFFCNFRCIYVHI